ncbi:hypothetical protein [Paenibacillus sp. UNC499MF]|uniref:hypothetical protein n=1 Tax=Paenibacillus sp. UNC499MF TaxID=1502751 RepID=UPI0008A0303D|nr:hypothetical protein [Paenibacillus sp. UNC499MF]SEF94903.1 hypothetical protein SAMN02799616_01548 [Paenibacillus sp. UNC499MF]
MTTNKNQTSKQGHLFTVKILMEEETNGLALQKLLQVLNDANFKDFSIEQGIELGKLIELNTAPIAPSSAPSAEASALGYTAASGKQTSSAPASKAGSSAPSDASASTQHRPQVQDQLRKMIKDNTLIRLSIVKGAGIRLSLPCRVLNFDEESGNVTVYHVDEKKVYLFKLNEIDNMSLH